MFNLLSYQPIINHLKQISPNMYKIKSDEINIHCPFCGDANRPNAYSHGHLYLSISSPVFHCFRCNTSGVLISLLLETNFNNDDILNDLKKYIKYRFTKNYFKTNKYTKISSLYDKIKKIHFDFKMNNKDAYDFFNYYIRQRIGNINDIITFLLYPDYVYNTLSISFLNSDDIISCHRNITNINQKYRYKINQGTYYFQDKKFDEYKSIVIAEGPFDIINAFLYLPLFKNSFFMSLNSQRYITEIEQLIIKYLFIGEFEINVIFDHNINYNYNIYKINYLKHLNKNIHFKYWTSCLTKDIGEFPKIMEL